MNDIKALIEEIQGQVKKQQRIHVEPTVSIHKNQRDPSETVTAVIPTIPVRQPLLQRALNSVWSQTSPVNAISVSYDHYKEGAWVNRWRAVQGAQTKWVAFLDDDDEWNPNYIEHLMYVAQATDSDMVWGWYDVVGGVDPFPHYRGKQYDPNQPHVVPICYMVKTELLLDTAGFREDPHMTGAWDVQDQPVVDAIVKAGGKLYAAPETIWKWRHDSGNTSGLPTRWDF